MRRSRALPEDFDFSQALQPTFKEARPLYGFALTDPLMLGGGVNQRPNLRLGMGHLGTASNSMNSSFTNHIPSPISATGSANPSPVSSLNEGSERSGSCFSASQSPLVASPQFANPFGRSHSLSSGSPAFQRQGRSFSQNSITGLGGQTMATISPSNPPLANDTFAYGNLPPLHFSRTPFHTRDDQRFGRAQTTEGTSHSSAMGMNQHYISPLSSPSTLSYDQSHMVYPSNSGYRASPSSQSSESILWQGSQMNPQGYHYGQQLQPHQAPEQRRGSESSQKPLSQDPSISRHAQRSYSSSENQRRVSLSSDPQSQLNYLGAEGATIRDTQQPPDAARPRARSETFPAYYNAR